MIESIELPNLVPRQRIGDCFEIHILHRELCDLMLSSHHNFLLEVWLHQCVFCKEPLLSWTSCKYRSYGPSGTEFLYCAYKIPLFSVALKLTHEKSSRVRLCVRELLSSTRFSLNFSNHSGRSRNRSPRACWN